MMARWMVWVGVVLGVMAGGAMAAEAATPLGTGNRPNIVFILIDDLAFDACSYAQRYPFMKTPHIDRLAHEGGRFANSFVTISLCSPSRSAYLSGLYAHHTGVPTNEKHEIDAKIKTWPAALHDNGYATAFIGKWHMGAFDSPRPGFDYWFSFVGQGVYNDPVVNENGKPLKLTGYITDILTDKAVDFIRQQKDKPFCVYLSHKAVHGPFTPAERHAHALDQAQMAEPISWSDNMEDKPAWLRRLMTRGGAGGEGEAKKTAGKKKQGKGPPDPAKLDQVPDRLPPQPWEPHAAGRIKYLETVYAVDDSVGRVYETLKEVGQLDNTVIVFTSDNGFFLGEHRRGDKRLMYEESLRVPMLIRYPKLVAARSVIEPMVLNVDIAPTMLELAGAPPVPGVQGKSFVRLLDGSKPSDWRTSFLYEYFIEARYGIPNLLGVRTEQYSYITAPDMTGDIAELYDIKSDPAQIHNLINSPKYAGVLTELKAELERLKKETGYHVPPMVRATLDEPATVTPVGPVKMELIARPKLGEKSADLDPSRKPLTVGAKVSSGDGVIISFGGKTNGFSLFVENGVPAFAVSSDNKPFIVRSATKLDGPAHVAGQITADGKLRLLINGKPVAQAPGRFIAKKPNQGMDVGTDGGSPVHEYAMKDLKWKGTLEDLRLYWGEVDETTMSQWVGGK